MDIAIAGPSRGNGRRNRTKPAETVVSDVNAVPQYCAHCNKELKLIDGAVTSLYVYGENISIYKMLNGLFYQRVEDEEEPGPIDNVLALKFCMECAQNLLRFYKSFSQFRNSVHPFSQVAMMYDIGARTQNGSKDLGNASVPIEYVDLEMEDEVNGPTAVNNGSSNANGVENGSQTTIGNINLTETDIGPPKTKISATIDKSKNGVPKATKVATNTKKSNSALPPAKVATNIKKSNSALPPAIVATNIKKSNSALPPAIVATNIKKSNSALPPAIVATNIKKSNNELPPAKVATNIKKSNNELPPAKVATNIKKLKSELSPEKGATNIKKSNSEVPNKAKVTTIKKSNSELPKTNGSTKNSKAGKKQLQTDWTVVPMTRPEVQTNNSQINGIVKKGNISSQHLPKTPMRASATNKSLPLPGTHKNIHSYPESKVLYVRQPVGESDILQFDYEEYMNGALDNLGCSDATQLTSTGEQIIEVESVDNESESAEDESDEEDQDGIYYIDPEPIRPSVEVAPPENARPKRATAGKNIKYQQYLTGSSEGEEDDYNIAKALKKSKPKKTAHGRATTTALEAIQKELDEVSQSFTDPSVLPHSNTKRKADRKTVPVGKRRRVQKVTGLRATAAQPKPKRRKLKDKNYYFNLGFACDEQSLATGDRQLRIRNNVKYTCDEDDDVENAKKT